MAQYIDKSAVMAEIERIKKEECPTDTYEGRCKLLWFEQFLSFLDKLEVKEVDLEKEIDRYCEPIQARQIQEAPYTSIEKCARHFYELGLKTQKGE